MRSEEVHESNSYNEVYVLSHSIFSPTNVFPAFQLWRMICIGSAIYVRGGCMENILCGSPLYTPAQEDPIIGRGYAWHYAGTRYQVVILFSAFSLVPDFGLSS